MPYPGQIHYGAAPPNQNAPGGYSEGTPMDRWDQHGRQLNSPVGNYRDSGGNWQTTDPLQPRSGAGTGWAPQGGLGQQSPFQYQQQQPTQQQPQQQQQQPQQPQQQQGALPQWGQSQVNPVSFSQYNQMSGQYPMYLPGQTEGGQIGSQGWMQQQMGQMGLAPYGQGQAPQYQNRQMPQQGFQWGNQKSSLLSPTIQ